MLHATKRQWRDIEKRIELADNQQLSYYIGKADRDLQSIKYLKNGPIGIRDNSNPKFKLCNDVIKLIKSCKKRAIDNIFVSQTEIDFE